MNERTKIILMMSASLIVIALSLMTLSVMDRQNKNMTGINDGYDCLVSGGYSWDDYVGACLRVWKLDENQREAAKIAVAPLSYPVTIIKVETLRCVGCFIVTLERNDNRKFFDIKLANWTYRTGDWDCSDYMYYDCPDNCVVCPPCEVCSSIVCQTEEFCKNIGFGKDWYENITVLSDEQVS